MLSHEAEPPWPALYAAHLCRVRSHGGRGGEQVAASGGLPSPSQPKTAFRYKAGPPARCPAPRGALALHPAPSLQCDERLRAAWSIVCVGSLLPSPVGMSQAPASRHLRHSAGHGMYIRMCTSLVAERVHVLGLTVSERMSRYETPTPERKPPFRLCRTFADIIVIAFVRHTERRRLVVDAQLRESQASCSARHLHQHPSCDPHLWPAHRTCIDLSVSMECRHGPAACLAHALH